MRIIVTTTSSTQTTSGIFTFDSKDYENLNFQSDGKDFLVSYTGGVSIFPAQNVLCFSVEGRE